MNLASVFEKHDGESVAIISRGEKTTYGELREQSGKLRAGLAEAGLKPGQRVGLVCGNNWYFVSSYLAILGAGCIAVPLNPSSPPAELIAQLQAVEASGVIIGPAARRSFDMITSEELSFLTCRIGCGFVPEGGFNLEDFLELEPTPIREADDDDLAVLVFTSGTAGSPKAACLSHGSLRSNIAQILSHPGSTQTPDDVLFGVLPLFHIFGLNVVLGLGLAIGATVLLVERFDPISALEAIEIHGVTSISGPPTMWAAWAGLPDIPPGTFDTVRLAVSGAARLSEETARSIERRTGVHIYEGFGLTEAAPVVTASIGTGAPFGSIGVPLPGMSVRVVDESGDDVLVGDSGELWIKGPNVFTGYWQNDEATATALNSDGWLMTGDVATVDDDGFLYLVDRVKDLIIVSGFNVYPAEVEEVLMMHPGIDSCAVVGVPHPYTGEGVKAYVVAAKGVSVEEDDIVSFCAGRLARYKCPKKIWFVDEVPRGMGGKVLRRALR